MDDLRVLVVEDEPLVAAGNAEYVGRIPGFEMVASVGTQRAALQVLRSERVDLVLLDLNLPDGHGLDIVRALRASGRACDVLTITAAREVDLVRSAASLGIVGYLLKPFTFADFSARLAAYRRFRCELAASGSANQGLVDAMLRDLHQPASAGTTLPKGLSAELLDRIIEVLRTAPPDARLSASDVADAVDTSRVTARRYLIYLTDAGRVARSQRTGGSGRPEITFVWKH
ncbi:MAG: response regulator [Tetrasphaera sp.]